MKAHADVSSNVAVFTYCKCVAYSSILMTAESFFVFRQLPIDPASPFFHLFSVWSHVFRIFLCCWSLAIWMFGKHYQELQKHTVRRAAWWLSHLIRVFPAAHANKHCSILEVLFLVPYCHFCSPSRPPLQASGDGGGERVFFVF